jgi:hypothetical protein
MGVITRLFVHGKEKELRVLSKDLEKEMHWLKEARKAYAKKLSLVKKYIKNQDKEHIEKLKDAVGAVCCLINVEKKQRLLSKRYTMRMLKEIDNVLAREKVHVQKVKEGSIRKLLVTLRDHLERMKPFLVQQMLFFEKNKPPYTEVQVNNLLVAMYMEGRLLEVEAKDLRQLKTYVSSFDLRKADYHVVQGMLFSRHALERMRGMGGMNVYYETFSQMYDAKVKGRKFILGRNIPLSIVKNTLHHPDFVVREKMGFCFIKQDVRKSKTRYDLHVIVDNNFIISSVMAVDRGSTERKLKNEKVKVAYSFAA